LYKADRGIGKKDKVKNTESAAMAVNPKSEKNAPTANTKTNMIRESDVQNMSAEEYEKNSDIIMESIRAGNFVYDVSGSAR